MKTLYKGSMMRKPLDALLEAYVNFTLRNKFIIPAVMLMFVTFLSVGIWMLGDQRARHEARLSAKAEQMTALLLSSNLESIWDVDRETLERNCRAFFEDQELTRLVIIDTLYGEDVLINFSKDVTGTQDIVKTTDVIKNGQKVAALEVVFTNYYIEHDLAQMRNTLIGLSVLMFLLMLSLITIVSYIALRPLQDLMTGVRHLTEGDLAFRIPVQSKDELGQLAVSFNTMAHELNLYHDRLQERTNELERSRQQLQAILDNSTAVIYLKDLEGQYLLINHQYERLFHVAKHEVMGKTDYDIFPKETADAFRAHDRAVIDADAPQEMEEYAPHDNGLHAYISIKVPLHDHSGRIYGVCGISTDITARKKAEDLLKNYNKQLEQEVEQRTQEWKIAREQALEAKEAAEEARIAAEEARIAAEEARIAAEAASRAKSTFLANMSHELRTPLHGILGFARCLEQDATLTEDQRENIAIISRNGKHLLTLLNDILDFTKVEVDTLALYPEEFALPSMLRQLADVSRIDAEQHGLAFVYDVPPTLPEIVIGDQKRLRQILVNLLGNAVKYTEKGTVTFEILDLRFKIAEPDKSESKIFHSVPGQTQILKFRISDSGIGIPPDQIEGIFLPFQQADPYRLQEGSTGLGLALSQQLALLMGSRIHVESVVGQGSTFWFNLELPVVDSSLTHIASEPKGGQESSESDEPLLATEDVLKQVVARLPVEWLEALEQGAQRADLLALSTVIEQIREQNTTVASVLTRLAEDFEYDKILTIIQARDVFD